MSGSLAKWRGTIIWYRSDLRILYAQVTLPLVEFYEQKNVLKTFRGTMSDVIYPEVKAWLEKHA
jgi:hypothetical protein